MKVDSRTLNSLIDQWKDWSGGADKSESGWQACFPRWEELVGEASRLMESVDLDEESIKLIEFSWQISEEDEDLLDFAKENINSCWTTLVRLCASNLPAVRWQVYEALGFSGLRGTAYLRTALEDKDPYCRRRAILALAHIGPSDSDLISERFLKDPDPYIRKAAVVLRESSGKR